MISPASSSPRQLSAEDRFEALFRELYARLYGLAFRVLGERTAAEDVLQETFLRLAKAEVLRWPTEQAAAWLARVCLNLAMNRRRDDHRWKRRQEAAVESSEKGVSHPDGPAQAVLVDEQRRMVRTILAALPSRQQECLLLRHSGYSYAEIAATLDVSVGSVGVLLSRAERAFRDTYLEHHHELP